MVTGFQGRVLRIDVSARDTNNAVCPVLRSQVHRVDGVLLNRGIEFLKGLFITGPQKFPLHHTHVTRSIGRVLVPGGRNRKFSSGSHSITADRGPDNPAPYPYRSAIGELVG